MVKSALSEMEKFVIIGENIHTTRIVLRDGKRHKTLQNGEEIILYVDSEGNQNNISVPDWFKNWENLGLIAWQDKNDDGKHMDFQYFLCFFDNGYLTRGSSKS